MIKGMELRRFFILETLLSDSDSTERQVMSRLWEQDILNRDTRNEPWAWYYNTTKLFAPMKKNGWIEEVGTDAENRKTWSITTLGTEAFIDEVKLGSVFADSLYARKKNKIVSLLAK